MQVLAAFLHFDEDDRLPDQIGKGGPARGVFFDAHFQRGARFFEPLLPECNKEPVQEDLGFPLFITSDVFGDPVAKLDQSLCAPALKTNGASALLVC